MNQSDLRNYQRAALRAGMTYFGRSQRSPAASKDRRLGVISIATGGGKTRVMAALTSSLMRSKLGPKRRFIILAPSWEILGQIEKELTKWLGDSASLYCLPQSLSKFHERPVKSLPLGMSAKPGKSSRSKPIVLLSTVQSFCGAIKSHHLQALQSLFRNACVLHDEVHWLFERVTEAP